MAGLAGRLERSIGRNIQLVHLEDAELVPVLIAQVLEHGVCSSIAAAAGNCCRLNSPRGDLAQTRLRFSSRTRCPIATCDGHARSACTVEAYDPDRSRALKAKIGDRVSDVRRHLVALRVAMAEFGKDFDLDAFCAAYATDDPARLNQVKAVERGVDQLYNYIAELTAFGLELAGLRQRGDELNARRDLAALRRSACLAPSVDADLNACASCGDCSSTNTRPLRRSRSTKRPASCPTSSCRSTTPTARGSAGAFRPVLRSDPGLLRGVHRAARPVKPD
jgi:hypothetical protein